MPTTRIEDSFTLYVWNEFRHRRKFKIRTVWVIFLCLVRLRQFVVCVLYGGTLIKRHEHKCMSLFELIVMIPIFRSRIHQEPEFQLLNRQLCSLRVVLRGKTAIKLRCVDPNDTIRRKKGQTELNM